MKNKNKKGFTLIELLAIIVILAIIAVITVPLILGIIDEAKTKAALNSVIGYGKAVELSYSKMGIDDSVVLTDAECNSQTAGSCVTIGDKKLKVDFCGDQVVCTGTSVTDGKLTMTGCKIGPTNAAGYANAQSYQYVNGQASAQNAGNGSSGS